VLNTVRLCIDHAMDVTAIQLRPIGTTLTVTQFLGFEDELRLRFLGPSLPPEFCTGNSMEKPLTFIGCVCRYSGLERR